MSRTPHSSVASFLESLSNADKTLADWARENGLDLTTAYQVSNGRLKGRHGEARRVMRAMGVKPPARRRSGVQASTR
jgi:gp16 family phage-associated protein